MKMGSESSKYYWDKPTNTIHVDNKWENIWTQTKIYHVVALFVIVKCFLVSYAWQINQKI